ncbi:hypothetical protein DsansV1_C08g0078211 [Dioscorea sansibarensis]
MRFVVILIYKVMVHWVSCYEGHHLMFYKMLLVVRSFLCFVRHEIAQN